ncbi:MAG TPA: recombinase RecA [Polyangia bacterium]|jgi:recombination protein RecA|nr:recombinase RecA [Polyangia bacterium]
MATDKTEIKDATSPAPKASGDAGRVASAGKAAAPVAAVAVAVVAPTPAPDRAPVVRERDAGRDKAIELTVSTIEKQFGKGSIMRLGEGIAPPEVQVVPTGSLGLDIALGVGGLPRGRVVEVYGPESSGKTTLALHVVAQAQRGGGICAFVDAEHALDVGYARKLGVRTDDLLVSQPDCGEQALEITEMLVRSGAVDVVVVDSVAALTPRAELEGEMGDAHVGLQARLMSQALRKLTGTIAKSNTLVIFINQIRMKIGVMFGNPETTTGGNALKFYASCRLDIRRVGALKDGEQVVGNRTRVKVVKNKMAPPFREVEFDILYGEGISHEGDLVDLGAECGVIEKSGAWFGFEGDRIGQGRENAKQYLRDHPDVARKIELKVLTHHGINRDGAGTSAAGEGAVAANGTNGGGTVHAFTPQPKPASEKRGR